MGKIRRQILFNEQYQVNTFIFLINSNMFTFAYATTNNNQKMSKINKHKYEKERSEHIWYCHNICLFPFFDPY